jgi:hypothetical protein
MKIRTTSTDNDDFLPSMGSDFHLRTMSPGKILDGISPKFSFINKN